jgi:hypothetical protein
VTRSGLFDVLPKELLNASDADFNFFAVASAKFATKNTVRSLKMWLSNR